MPSAPIAPRPLIVTTDAELLDELVRLAAAAGVEPEVAPDAVAARRRWTAAPMVLVGTDAGGRQSRPGGVIWMGLRHAEGGRMTVRT